MKEKRMTKNVPGSQTMPPKNGRTLLKSNCGSFRTGKTRIMTVGAGADIHKEIGSLPKRKGGWTLGIINT